MKRSNPKRYARPRFPGQHRGTIGSRHDGWPSITMGRSFFQSTESSSTVEVAARIKNPKMAPPVRATFQYSRAREGKDLQRQA